MQKRNNTKRKPNGILILSFYLFLFFYLGFVFHNSKNGLIFGKYSVPYFAFLVVLPFVYFVLLRLIRLFFCITTLHIQKRKVFLSTSVKLLFVFLVAGAFFMSTEFLLRKYHLHPTTQPSLPKEDFHPFLQLKNSQQDNALRPQLHINSLGFRGEEIGKEKSPDTYRIFILGGSTVYNEYTPYEENTARVLEKQLQVRYPDKKIEVMNAGVRYYNSEHSIIQYLFKIKDYNPDLIIVWQGANDMAASCTDMGNDTYGQYSDDYSHKFGPLITVFNYFYSPKPMFNLATVDYLAYIAQNTLYSDFRKSSNSPDTSTKPPGKPINMSFQSITAYKRNLLSLIKILREDNVKLILGNQPFLYNKTLDKSHSWDLEWVCRTNTTYPNISSLIDGMRKINQTTKDVASQEDIQFVDIEEKIPKTLEYFSDDFHFYPAISNKIVADALFQNIISNSYIKN